MTAARGVTVRMPAKLNLHLGVFPGRDERGYHRVETIMVPVGIYDTLTVRASNTLQVECNPPVAIAPERSAVWRTIATLANALGVEPKVRVEVERGIPSEGGLGSASADTAAVIRACCRFWDADTNDDEVRAIARGAGADVAFFMHAMPARFCGVGNELVETYPPVNIPVAIVKPNAGVSTVAAYEEFDRSPTPPASARAMAQALATSDVTAIAANLHNNLEPAATRLVPELASMLAWLHERPGVAGAQVTGSGSCVFALCNAFDAAASIARDAQAQGLWAIATHTVGGDAATTVVL